MKEKATKGEGSERYDSFFESKKESKKPALRP